MNNKCFTTNYQREVSNDNLPHVGEIKFKVVYGDKFNFANDGDEDIHVVTDGDIQGIVSRVDTAAHTAREFTVPKGSWFNASAPVGTTVKIYPRYGMNSFSATSTLGSNPSYKEMDISQLAYMTKATSISFLNNGQSLNLLKSTYGDIKAFATDTSLTSLDVSSTNVSGDIAAVKNLTALTYLKVGGTNVSGDIAVVQNLTALTYLDVSKTNVSGDIAVVQNLTALTNLSVGGTNVSGDIAAVQNLTALTALNVGGTNVSGDISAISHLTSLTYLALDNTQVSGKIDSLANLTKLTFLGSFKGLSLTGDMSKIPAGVYFISQIDRKVNTNFTWTAGGRQNATLLAMEGAIPFDTTSMDNMLIDQATCTISPEATMPYHKAISVSGTRTSASDAAVAAIQNKGITITGVTKI